jgi:hypothetical protein
MVGGEEIRRRGTTLSREIDLGIGALAVGGRHVNDNHRGDAQHPEISASKSGAD